MKINKNIVFFAVFLSTVFVFTASAEAGEPKSKFYNFSDQLIDGEVRRPTALYTDVRQEVKFKRLLRLKRDMLGNNIQKTSRNRVFK